MKTTILNNFLTVTECHQCHTHLWFSLSCKACAQRIQGLAHHRGRAGSQAATHKVNSCRLTVICSRLVDHFSQKLKTGKLQTHTQMGKNGFRLQFVTEYIFLSSTWTAPKQMERSCAGMCPFQKAVSPSSEYMQRVAWNNPQYFPAGLSKDTRSICSWGGWETF